MSAPRAVITFDQVAAMITILATLDESRYPHPQAKATILLAKSIVARTDTGDGKWSVELSIVAAD